MLWGRTQLFWGVLSRFASKPSPFCLQHILRSVAIMENPGYILYYCNSKRLVRSFIYPANQISWKCLGSSQSACPRKLWYPQWYPHSFISSSKIHWTLKVKKTSVIVNYSHGYIYIHHRDFSHIVDNNTNMIWFWLIWICWKTSLQFIGEYSEKHFCNWLFESRFLSFSCNM